MCDDTLGLLDRHNVVESGVDSVYNAMMQAGPRLCVQSLILDCGESKGLCTIF